MHGTLHANLDLCEARFVIFRCLRKSLSWQTKGQLGEKFHEERDKSTMANIFARIQSRRVALYRRLFNIRDENFVSFYHNWRWWWWSYYYPPGRKFGVHKLLYRGESCLWTWAGNYFRNGFSRLSLIWKQRYGTILVQYRRSFCSLMFKIWSLQMSRCFIWHDRNKITFAISLEEFSLLQREETCHQIIMKTEQFPSACEKKRDVYAIYSLRTLILACAQNYRSS